MQDAFGVEHPEIIAKWNPFSAAGKAIRLSRGNTATVKMGGQIGSRAPGQTSAAQVFRGNKPPSVSPRSPLSPLAAKPGAPKMAPPAASSLPKVSAPAQPAAIPAANKAPKKKKSGGSSWKKPALIAGGVAAGAGVAGGAYAAGRNQP